jgi:hypothetical protein
MKRTQRHVWLAGLGLALAVLMLLPGLSAPDGAAVEEQDFHVTDYGLFIEELHAAGALKFFENTEDLLRIAEFERALLRYRFLKGQIARDPGYRPLVAVINQRLAFLAGQLRLGEEDLASLTPTRIKRRRPSQRASIPAPPPAAPEKTPVSSTQSEAEAPSAPGAPESGQDSSPAPEILPALHPAPASSEPPPVTASPGTLPTEPVQVQEPPPEAQPAPPPPSRWQRFKDRLRSWRK